MRVVVIGNSGSGKSTLALRLARSLDLAAFDLDTVAWLPEKPPRRRPLAESARDVASFIAAHGRWVIEGCYADLVAAALPSATKLVFLNPGVDACVINARLRPWEPHKYATREEQDANLDMLIAWIKEYEVRSDTFSLRAHRALFDAFAGDKVELTDRAAIARHSLGMDVRVVAAERSDERALENLFQLYAHDFSEIVPLEVDEAGRFVVPPLDAYWNESWRFPFLIRGNAHLAGFALVDRKSRLSTADDVWDMAEFFVLRAHRRAGLGTAAAHCLFSMHPGPWEVRQRNANVAATSFWRAAISAFTGGQYSEELVDDERWRGPVQRFTSGGGNGGRAARS